MDVEDLVGQETTQAGNDFGIAHSQLANSSSSEVNSSPTQDEEVKAGNDFGVTHQKQPSLEPVDLESIDFSYLDEEPVHDVDLTFDEDDEDFDGDFGYLDEPSPIERNEAQLHTKDERLTSELSALDSVGQLWDDMWERVGNDVAQGWEQSITGMIYTGEQAGERVDKPNMYDQIISGTVQGLIDTPYNLAGWALGFAGGAGNPVTGMTGAFALPGVVRQAYVDHLEKGEIKDAGDFGCRLVSALKAGAEEGMVGAMTGGIGGKLKPMLQPFKAPIEAVAMTTVSSILHEKMPTVEDFAVSATTIGAMHLATNAPAQGFEVGMKAGKKGMAMAASKKMNKRVQDNLQKIYKETGKTPEEVVKDIGDDPSIVFDLLAKKKTLPRAYKDVPILKPSEHTNLSYAVDKHLIEGTEIWKYKRKDFDEILRDGKDIGTFMKQAKYEIGKKIKDQVGTDDLQTIANYYHKKYLFPVEFKVIEEHMTEGTLGYVEAPQGLDIAKRGLNDLDEPYTIHISHAVTRDYGREGAIATLRHEIEHALDMQKRFQGTNSADWAEPHKEAHQEKTPADRVRTATSDPLPLHHKEYTNFEMDYLHKAMVRDALARGEKVPENVLYDYPEIQEYGKVRIDQKVVVDPEAGEKALPFKESARKAIDKFYELAIDDLNPLRQMEINLLGAKKADDMSATVSVYKTARIAKGQIGKAKQYFEYGGFDRGTFEKNSASLKEIIDEIPKKDYDGFVHWLVMQRAVELESQGMKSGFENIANKHETVMEGSTKGYDKIFNKLRDYQTSLLQQLVDSGVLSKKQLADMTSIHKFYVPFQRELGETMTHGKQSLSSLEAKKVVYRYKGSSKPVVNPLYSIVDNTFQILRAAENNTIMQRLVEFSKYDPDGHYIKRIEHPLELERDGGPDVGESAKGFVLTVLDSKGKERYGVVTSDNPRGAHKGKLGVRFGKDRQTHYVDKKEIVRWEGKRRKNTKIGTDREVKNTSMVDDIERKARALNKGIEEMRPEDFVDGYASIKVYEDGKPHYYRVHEDIAMTLKNMDIKIPKILKMLSGPASMLRVGATLNPDFPATNILKDQVDAYVFAKNGYVPILDTFRGLCIRKSQGEKFQTWLKGGGYNSVLVAMDKPHLGKRMFHELQKLPVNNKMNFSKNPMHYLRAVSEYAEEGTRLGIFNKALKKGVSIEDAVYESRDTTIDFSKAGAYGRKWNVITAFFNASVQGNIKMVEQMRLHPKKVVSRAMLAITLPSIVNMLANYDDEEYWKIPEWQRDLFWCVKINGGFARIPKPFILGTMFGTLPERMMASFLRDGDHKDFEGFGTTLLEAFTPPIIPTVASPFVDMLMGKDRFTGQNLIPADMEGALPEFQYTRSTGATARLLSKAVSPFVSPFMSSIGLGDHSSPIEVKHLIQSWTGGLGRHAINLSDTILKSAGVRLDELDVVEPSTDLIDKIPVIRAFHVRTGSSATADVSSFFDRYAEYQKINKSMALEKKRLHYNNVSSLMDEADYKSLDGVYSSLMNVFHLIRNIENMPTLDEMSEDEMADWKRQHIENLYKNADALAVGGNQVMDMLEEYKKEREDTTLMFFNK